MTADDVPAAERVTAIGFHELDTRMFRRSWPDPQLRPPERGASWVDRTRHLVAHRPGRLLGGRGRRRAARGRRRRSCARRCGCLATYAVVPGAAGPRPRQGAARAGAASTAAGSPARDAQRVRATRRRVRRYHAGRVPAAPADVPARAPSTAPRSRWSRRCARAAPADVDLMDSDRPADPWRRARARPRAAAAASTGWWSADDHDRVGLRLPRRRAGRPARRDQPAYGGAAAVGGARRRRRGARWSATSPRRTSGRVDVGLAARLELAPGGYLALRGMRPPAPYLHHGALL